MRRTAMRWAAVVVFALAGMAVAAEEAQIEIRAYRVSGPLSGPRWEAMRQRWDDSGSFRIGHFDDAVQPGDFVTGGLSLHMEGDTLQWVGESATDHPHVLAFDEAVVRNREAVTLRLDYPRLAFTRRADGSFSAEMAERGEEFTLMPELRWKGEELAWVGLRVGPASHDGGARSDGFVPYIHLKDVALGEVLSAIVGPLGLAYRAEKDCVVVSTPARLRQRGTPLPPSEALEKSLAKSVSVEFEKIHLVEIMDFLKKSYNLDYTLDSEAVALPGEKTASGPLSGKVWTMLSNNAKQGVWAGVVFSLDGFGGAPERYLFVFSRAYGDAPPAAAPAPPQMQYTVEVKFFQTGDAGRCQELVAEHLTPQPEAAIQGGALSLYGLGGDLAVPHADRAAIFLDALEQDCALELLSAPRLTTAARSDNPEEAASAKIFVRNPRRSGGAVAGGSLDENPDLTAMLRGLHPLLAQWFSRIVQAGKKPAVIMDIATGYYSPEALADGVDGVEIISEGGPPLIMVSTGTALAFGVAATEDEGVVDLDLCVAHRVKHAPVKGHWPFKKRLPVSFPSAACAVHYRHDLVKQPLFFGGPGAQPGHYLIVQIDMAIAPRRPAQNQGF